MKPTTSWIKYAAGADGYGVKNHCCPIEFEADLVARIKAAYGDEPTSIERLSGAPLTLDTGGVILGKMGWVRHKFSRYSVRCREEHALLYAGYLETRLADTERHRKYNGVLCLTLYQEFWSPVIPVRHAQKLLHVLKKDGVENHTRATGMLAELAAEKPEHIHIPFPKIEA